MKYLVFAFINAVIIVSCSTTGKLHLTKDQLPGLIDSLYKADQSTAIIKPPDSAAAAYQRVIRTNFSLVTGIFKTFGYPGYDLVGKELSNQYFLLVQHSDFDVAFQQEVLKKMKKQVEKQNASGRNFAFLIDRVELNSGRLQIYGTQVNMNRNTSIRPCIDTANLDKRRRSIGLEPIREYLDKCNDAFYSMNPQEKRPEKP